MSMNRRQWMRSAALAATAVALAACARSEGPYEAVAQSQLLIILDGLRPDYVTPDLMPNLHALGERGIVFNDHHSVYPTVTRVNAASIATGAYPQTHGLMGNSVYAPEVDATRSLTTSARENLEAIDDATGGHLLTAPSLGEVLQAAGRKLLVVSAGSPGSALLLNHTIAGGAVFHTEVTLPDSLHPRVLEVLGEVPDGASPSEEQNRRAVDAYLRMGLEEIRPDVTIMWLTDPDGTAHANGIGAPPTRQALERVDAEIGRIQTTLDQKGLRDEVNVLVTSDHGFSTHTGGMELRPILDQFINTLDDGSQDVIVAGGAIYFREAPDEARLTRIVEALQQGDGIGAIFTRPRSAGDFQGIVPGTLSHEVAHWNHERAAAILVSANWTDEANEHGYQGTTTQGGVAGHGSTSRFDIHNALIAAGPDFRQGVEIDLPTGNTDLAPTLLYLFGLEIPATMEGRIIKEALRSGPPPSSVEIDRREYTTRTNESDQSYILTAYTSIVDGHQYLDYTEVTRQR